MYRLLKAEGEQGASLSVVMANKTCLPPEFIRESVYSCLKVGEYFSADEWQLPFFEKQIERYYLMRIAPTHLQPTHSMDVREWLIVLRGVSSL